MKGRLFDIAWVFIPKLNKDWPDWKVFKCKSGDRSVWIGNYYSMIRVMPCITYDGMEVNFDLLENEYSFLKDKKRLQEVDVDKLLERHLPDKIEGNEVEFTDVIIPLETGFVARIFKYKNKLMAISHELDGITYDLRNDLTFIMKDDGNKTIIGLLPDGKSIKERACILAMPLKPDENIVDIIEKLMNDIEQL